MKTSQAPFSVQHLSGNYNGYPDWAVYAVRDSRNHCLAVVGQVDRATSECNQGNAELFALAPDMAQALIAVGRVLNMSDSTHPDFKDSGADCIEELWMHEAEIRIILHKLAGSWHPDWATWRKVNAIACQAAGLPLAPLALATFPAPPSREQAALLSLISTIENTGGLTECGAPKADPEWLDLGDVYKAACEAIGCQPKTEEP